MANKECGRQKLLELTRNTELEQVRQEERVPNFTNTLTLEVERRKIIAVKDHCI